jgi:hypothetical protein
MNWGGPGLLGADVAAGLGHRLPLRKIDEDREAGIIDKPHQPLESTKIE